jgi:hypothetical protein
VARFIVKAVVIGIVLAIFIVVATARSQPLSTTPSPTSLVYISRTSDKSQFHWHDLGNSYDRIMDVDGNVNSAVLAGTRVAFVDNNRMASVVDLSNRQQTDLSIKLQIAEGLLLYDEYSARQLSLIWSPSGRYLAFTGLTNETHSDVYVWDSQNGRLTNLTEKLPYQYVDVGSWSHDERWLSFAALIDDEVEPFIASLDGETMTRLIPGQSACRLMWSPDDTQLVSTTHCFQSLGADTQLKILTFDPNHPNQPSAPTRIVSETYGRAISRQYDRPRWYDNRTIITIRNKSLPAITSAADLYVPSKTELITYDVQTQRESLVPIGASFTNIRPDGAFGNWLYFSQYSHTAHSYAYNIKFGTLINLTGLYQCVDYSLSDDGQFAAIGSGCTNNADTHDYLRVVALPSRREILKIKAGESEYLTPVGFISMP